MKIVIRASSFVIWILLMTACGSVLPSTAPSPVPTRIRVAPGQVVDIPVEPKAGPTEENPVVTLHITIADEKKNAPVKANWVTLGDREVGRDVSELILQLPGDLRDHPLLLHVEADGYQPWEMVLRHYVKYSRRLEWNIVLRPKGQVN